MHLQAPESSGSPILDGQDLKWKHVEQRSSALPFGQAIPFSSITGPTYLTAQTLIQQVAYALSDKLFTYSPDTFDLDVAVKQWHTDGCTNAYGYTTHVSSMQTRTGAASIALGYIFSKDFDLKKRHIPQSILASSSSLLHLRSSLDQLSLLYSVASPLTAHIAAVDYAPNSSSSLVSDYSYALTLADELGYGLVSSFSPYEAQHMALFATLLASVVPTIHIYDGVTVGRETSRVIDVLDQDGLYHAYKAILDEMSGPGKKHLDLEGKAGRMLRALNGELGTGYKAFEYEGHSEPDSVLVVFGTVESSLAAQVASILSNTDTKVGVLSVRLYRPFLEDEFIASIPKSAKVIATLGQVQDAGAVFDSATTSRLYQDVLAALTFSATWKAFSSVVDIKYPRDHVWTPTAFASVFRQLSTKQSSLSKGEVRVNYSVAPGDNVIILDSTHVQQYTFWDVADSNSIHAPLAIAKLLSINSANNITTRTGHDNLVHGGILRTDIRSSKRIIDAPYSVDQADVVYVGEEKLLDSFDVLDGVRPGGTVLLRLPGAKDDDVHKRLPSGFKKGLLTKRAHFFILDPEASATVENHNDAEILLTELAFLKLARKDLVLQGGLEKLAAINGTHTALQNAQKDLLKAVRQFEVPEDWGTVGPDVEKPQIPSSINQNSFTPFEKEEIEPPAPLRSWEAAAKGLAFKEAFKTNSALRPDLSVKTWTVHVKENRRLTPLTYDRNIFHIEFDLGDSGLTYNIGEALGVHGENDKEEVEAFIKFYGLQPEDILEVPSRDDPTVLESRTVYQALLQNIDIFGRPPKRFYETLAEFADDENEKKELLTLGGPEGATEFKRRAEVDTITYADVLLEFPSAHPAFHDIVRIVSPLKRREYSIASSQQVTPTSVALLVVVVGWVDPKGRDRFGQCTRYLSKLPVGAPLTVSVKPSVMKLPAKSTQPLIMAGLGTGLAPFRAFVQYRAWQKSQGMDIGAVLLYMGSRHQREEYLYGEEWEAYQDAGVITLLGRAFSRDQPQKIYIQDRMRESLNEIIKAYLKEEGAFYLCGPTWPVPDVTQVLQEAISRDAKSHGKRLDPRKEIEKLKEELRYVLEVY